MMKRTIALAIAGVFLVAGIACLLIGYQQWQQARSPLGVVEHVSEYGKPSFYPATDGRYILFLQSGPLGSSILRSEFSSDDKLIVKDTRTGRQLTLHPDLGTNLQLQGAANRFLDGGQFLHQDGILDLSTGETAPASWGTAQVQGLRGSRVFLWNQTSATPGFLDLGNEPTWLTMPSEASSCPGSNRQVAPIDQDSFLVEGCPVNDSSRLQVWHHSTLTGEWQSIFSSGSGAARSSKGAAMTATPDEILIVVRGATPNLRLRILDPNLAVRHDLDLGLQGNYDVAGVTASPHGWAVHTIETFVDVRASGGNRLPNHLVWGTPDGQLSGHAEREVGIWKSSSGPTQVTSDGLLTGLDALIVLAHPGESKLPMVPFLVVGALLVIVGITVALLSGRHTRA